MTGAPRAAILGFHAIERGPAPLCVPPDVFERQVAALADSGAVALSVTDLARRVQSGSLPARAVAFTFDDGYESAHRHALPVLERAGFIATVFPVTSQLGGTNTWDRGSASGLRLLGRAQLQELQAAGWEVGGHTHTHRPLPRLSEGEVLRELRTSTDHLEDVLGSAVRSFAYPYGAWDPVSRRLAGWTHDACLGIGASLVGVGSPLDLLERVDAWYLRRAWQLRRLHGPVGRSYLMARRAGRRVDRTVRRRAV